MHPPIFSRATWLTLFCSIVIVASALTAPASLAGSLVGQPTAERGKPDSGPQSTRPNAAYALMGDASNTGTDSTSFTSSDTAWGTVGAWRFYASGEGETALRGYCYGVNSSCWGAYIEGQRYGIFAQADNGSGISIGVYGISYGTGGQGVAGVNAQTGGFGGVFTATGSSGIGIRASSLNGVGGFISSTIGNGLFVNSESAYGINTTANQNAALYALSGVYGASSPAYSIVGDSYIGSTTSGLAAYSDRANGGYGQSNGGIISSTGVIAGLYGKNNMVNGGSALANAGVFGSCTTCNGVLGETTSYVAVRGRVTSTGTVASYGGYFTTTAGVGVYGGSDSNNGVYGKSNSGNGLIGISTSLYGVRAASTSSYGVLGTSDISVGVRGTSDTYYGFYAGSTSGTGGYSYTASGPAAFRAKNNQPDVAGHYGIISDGDLLVNGDITCTGSCLAAMGVKTSSGEKLVYADSSTQSVISDQGTATLKDGRAVVKIDPLFAQAVNLGAGYQVFVTPRSFDTPGLGVSNYNGSSFEVRELNKGKGNFSFDYRITAVRKGYEKNRLENAPTVAPAATEPDLPRFTAPSDKLNENPPASKVEIKGKTASGLNP